MIAFVKRMLGSLRGRKTQLALAVRLAGFEPPGDHDLFFTNALV